MWFRRAFPWLFVLAVAAGLFELATLTMLPWNASMGCTWAPTSRPFIDRAIAVTGPARAAGIEVGDIIDTREGDNSAPRIAGTPFTLIAHRGARTLRATIVPIRIPMPWDQAVRLAGVFWVLMFAFLIYRKGGAVKENDYLILTLLLIATQSSLGRTPLPDSRLQVLYYCIGNLALSGTIVALAFYGMQFRGRVSRWRQSLFYTAIAVSVLGGICNDFGDVNALVAVDLGFGVYPWISTLLEFTIPLLLALLTVVAAIPHAPRADRQRLAWVAAAFVPWYLGVTLGSTLPDPIWYTIENISFFVIPAGLTYAALSRRLFDVGFVLNRAAIFTAVSVLVVGVFVLVEWGFGEWLRDASRTTNVIVSAALALLLGLSVRFVHGRVEHVVDNVFFRKRHEDEAALRNFAHEAGYINTMDTLLERTISIVERHSGATCVQAVLDADHDDPAIVALRAWHKPIDLHAIETSLRGELAFPMVARGRLVGALVLGPKSSGETYAPDESDAIRQVANAVGLALDVLSLRTHSIFNGESAGIEQFAATVADPVARSLRAQTVE